MAVFSELSASDLSYGIMKPAMDHHPLVAKVTSDTGKPGPESGRLVRLLVHAGM